MSSFAKLDSGIVDSTLWMQPHDVLRVWIAMLAKADASGYVRASVPAMAHLCMVPIERLEQVLSILMSPDPYSRTDVDEGRRLRVVAGGWQIVNYLAYRNSRDTEADKARKREWDRKNRPSGHSRSKASDDSPTRSDAVRQEPTGPTQAEAEAEAEQQRISPRAEPADFAGSFEGHSDTAPKTTPGATAAGAIAADLRRRGYRITSTHPDLLAAVAEGVTPDRIAEFAEIYPPDHAKCRGSPGYVISAARRQLADTADPISPGTPREPHRRLSAVERVRANVEAAERRDAAQRGSAHGPAYPLAADG